MTSMPGAAGWRWWLANSTRACDTPGMSVLSRPLRRWQPIRVGAAVLGLAWGMLIGAFVYAASTVTPDTSSIVAAAAGGAVCGGRLLDAWARFGRLPTSPP